MVSDTLSSLIYGFSIALTPENLILCLAGATLGTLIGVLPGLGPVAAISILLPLTFKLPPAGSIIMLAGIYYGAMYGGSTTSILLNVPGEAASVITCLDGYQMARAGRAASALAIAAIGSFIAGTFGIIGLTLIAKPLVGLALRFGPCEYFALVLLGLTFVVYVSHGSRIKAFIMCVFGLILGCVGLDPITSAQRFTFGIPYLFEGLGIAQVAMGLFGIGEVLVNMERIVEPELVRTKIRNLFLTYRDWLEAKWAILRGSLVGFMLGLLPGGGPVVASFLAYGVEKRFSKTPQKFGSGAVEGVAAPESANNAAASTSFVPLLVLGIPPNVMLAVLFGAFLVHGIVPGPLLLKEKPDIFWGVISSMYIGNVMLLILNLPLIPLWVQILKISPRILYPLILLLCVIGAYSINNSVFDVYVVCVFGLIGYFLRKLEFEPAPLVLSMVLSKLLDLNMRQMLIAFQGDYLTLFRRPISLTIILVVLILVISAFKKKRK
ncbi:MAG: tripartite tricarboxylate transporter permease [Deltaproteobacteria bacterium]|nr:tripartite tricarboxylate transporter permease [Deltaproteobacteria bacterium]